MLWILFFFWVLLGNCHHGNGATAFVLSENASTKHSTTKTSALPASEKITTTSEQTTTQTTMISSNIVPIKRRGPTKNTITDLSFTRVPIGHPGLNIVADVTLTVIPDHANSGSQITATTGKETEEETDDNGKSNKATILAVVLPISAIILLTAGIILTLCLLRLRKRKQAGDMEDGWIGQHHGNIDGGGWRERLASHINPKRKDTRINADDNHPYVLYNVKEGRARSFGRLPSFTEIPPMIASGVIENEAINSKDEDSILYDASGNICGLENPGYIPGQQDLVGSDRPENPGYIPDQQDLVGSDRPENPGYTPELQDLVGSDRLETQLELSQVVGAAAENKAISSAIEGELVHSHEDSDEMGNENEMGEINEMEGHSKEYKGPADEMQIAQMMSDAEVAAPLDFRDVTLLVPEDAMGAETASVHSSSSNASSVCGFWSPNPEVADSDDEGKEIEGEDEASSSDDDVTSDVDDEPPYSTWPGRKPLEEFSESESEASLIEPIGSEEEEDPYDVVIPRAAGEQGVTMIVKRPVIKCISALKGEFSDSELESTYDSLPGSELGSIGKCEDLHCQACRQESNDLQAMPPKDSLGPYDLAGHCEWSSPELSTTSKCLICQTSSSPNLKCEHGKGNWSITGEESPYDTLPPGRPRSVVMTTDQGSTVHVFGEDDTGNHTPTNSIGCEPEVLASSSLKKAETVIIQNMSSSSEDSLPDDECKMDAKRMSLEISDFGNEADPGQGHSRDEQRENSSDEDFVFM